MKTSEEKLNEALRAALKRKFDDFEEQPNPSSFQVIRAHIKKPRNYKYLFLSGLLIGVFVTGIVLNQYRVTKRPLFQGVAEKADVNKESSKASHEKDIVSGSTQTAIDLTAKPNSAQETGTTQHRHNLLHKISKREIKSDRLAQVSKNRVKPDVVSQVSKNETKEGLLSQRLATQIKSDPFQQVSENQLTTTPSPIVLPGDPDVLIKEEANHTENEILLKTTLSSDLSELEPGQMKPVAMHLPGVDIPKKPRWRHAIHTNPQTISWLFNVASLKTYQILTVPKSVGEDFQNFKFPSVFSLESIGYKLSAGLEKKGFQALLHYSTFRQNYSYEVAGNEYIVKSVDEPSYNIVRPGTVVTENTKMDLLGIGLSKEVQWGRSGFQKYYASAGLEYSHALKSGPGVGWINASVGKQFVISRTAVLHVGPYAEFSPTKIAGADNPFLYQPYRVGISVGMKLIRP